MEFKFCTELKKKTYENHKKLDHHEFVKTIYFNEKSKKHDYIKKYIHLHLIMLHHIKDIIYYKKFNIPSCFDYFDKDYNRYIKDSELYSIHSVGEYLKVMESDAENYQLFLSHCYTWYLALLYGGQIIKKKILIDEFEEEVEILTEYNCNRNELIYEIKEYLENTINTEKRELFINKVNDNYTLIYNIFDELI